MRFTLQRRTQPHRDPLQPLDQVFVPKTQIANVNVWVEQWIRNNLPINSMGLGLTAF
jgi:hypothetical protein